MFAPCVCFTLAADMFSAKFMPKAYSRVPLHALHKCSIWFRKLRRKPILTNGDVKERYKWVRTHRNKPRSWWRTYVQVHIKGHAVKVLANGKANEVSAARRDHGS